MSLGPEDTLGARPAGGARATFTVWAPHTDRVAVQLDDGREETLDRQDDGYHVATLGGCPTGTRYRYRLDGGTPLPDPASRAQPEGVHGPSAVVDPGAHGWRDDGWRGIPMQELVLYELHVGTFTDDGTFDAAAGHLEGLRALGVTCVELMPIAAFPGTRNWGYDGVFPFAVQESYGGPEGLRRFVDRAHRHGVAVCLDVVYNHVGPEGNVLPRYGPYFTDRYKTAWGAAPNLDGRWSDDVRRYFIENARHWVSEHHIDALRLDAVHAIVDTTAAPFLQELTTAVHARAEGARRVVHVIAESDDNDPRLVRPRALGGYGMDAVWADDLHHAVHAALTREDIGYYADFGTLRHLANALRQGFVYTGQYSHYRGRRHGASPAGIPPQRFIACIQNHDQVGNRADGARLITLAGPERARIAAATLLLSPFIPLLFMGEEYGATTPFHFFTDHADTGLIEAVRSGRRRELRGFGWPTEPLDPQDPETFRASRIRHGEGKTERAQAWWHTYQALLALRKQLPALGPHQGPHAVQLDEESRVIAVTRTRPAVGRGPGTIWLALHYGEGTVHAPPPPDGDWSRHPLPEVGLLAGSGARAPERLIVHHARVEGATAGVPLGAWDFALYTRRDSDQRTGGPMSP